MSWAEFSDGGMELLLPIGYLYVLSYKDHYRIQIFASENDGATLYDEKINGPKDKEELKKYALKKLVELLRQQASTIESHMLHENAPK
jgi:hypothetical protein